MIWPLEVHPLSVMPTLDTFGLLFLHPVVLWGCLSLFYTFGEKELWGRTTVFTLTLFIIAAYLQDHWPPFNSTLNAAGEQANILSDWLPSVGVIVLSGMCGWVAWESKKRVIQMLCAVVLISYTYAISLHAPLSWQSYVGSLLIVSVLLLAFDIISVRLAAKYPQITGFIISAGTIYLILKTSMEYTFVYAIQAAMIGFTLGWMISGGETVAGRFSLAQVYRFLILGFGSILMWMLLTMLESMFAPLTYASIFGFTLGMWVTTGVSTIARFYNK